jgi:hypothetical protein
MTQRRKLLVIDDDPAIFRHLRRDLMREGYDVVAASGQGIIAWLDGMAARYCAAGPRPTARQVADSDDQSAVSGALDWIAFE